MQTSSKPIVTAAVAVFAVIVASLLQVADAKLPEAGLDITGKITKYTDAERKTYHLSEADIAAMPQYVITTSTPWTSRAKFAGIRIEDVLAKVGATGTSFRITGYDGFISSDIPFSDVEKYHPIFATSMNGVKLKIRNFGPFFIVYPRDGYYEELNNSKMEASFARQVKSLEVN
ncbi:hypothetical protein BWP39_30525 [Paraburkholderia acidicola]|uniref:Oxidoreductase molybdopterin-binding domain-containing protein n=1 Tax=Paraburkholderia acidicola TaxID=1912599 RepID=A0A2A4ES99_9BURK|nr:molybdopterin-dependent oxidoreductase [Paraburkholderia acidicola]PCE24021.1 hypothetical protein BWP39_30525 [Paraburkholderia acidicola]